MSPPERGAAGTLDAHLEQALVRAVGRAHVLADPELTASFETDWTGRWSGRARCVVRPASTEQVAAVLCACAEGRVPVVPQGGNTGLVGGGVPRGGEVVLSTRRLDAVGDVDRAAGELVVGAGTTLEAVQAAARAAGFDFGIDIAPRQSCTIGGMIATNAGGVHVVRWGMMAEQVIGVEAVCADGTVIGRVPDLRKDNAGYRLSSLLAGSEGTLAVLTRAHLRLVPALEQRAAALLAFADGDAAMRAVAALRTRLPSLIAIEIVFREGVDLYCRATGAAPPLRAAFGAALLVECAAGSSPLEELASAIDSLGPAVLDSAVGADAPAARRLWRYREGVPEAIRAMGVAHKMDVSLPVARLAGFAAAVQRRVEELAPQARVILFGHAADGNLHVNVLGLAPDDDAVDRAILRLAADLGGSIAAEHGVGVAKAHDLGLSRSPADISAMRAIKRAFDPGGVLNPGVLLA